MPRHLIENAAGRRGLNGGSGRAMDRFDVQPCTSRIVTDALDARSDVQLHVADCD